MGFVVPLGEGVVAVWPGDSNIGAPGMFVPKHQMVPGLLPVELPGALQPAVGGGLAGCRQCVGGAQPQSALAVEGLLACAAGTAKIPKVSPVPAVGGELRCVLFDRGPPLARGGEANVGALSGVVPRIDPVAETSKGRPVVAERMVALDHERRERVADRVEPGLHARPPDRFKLFLAASDPEAPALVVRPAIVGEDRAPAWPQPEEGVGAYEGRATEVGVDGHGEAFDAGIEQQVDQWPAFAVDIAVHGGGDREAVVAAQPSDRLQAFDQLVGVEQRCEIGVHPGHLDPAGPFQRLKAFDLGGRGVLQPAVEHIGVLDGPSKSAVTVAVGAAFCQGERLADKAFVQVEDDGLVVGVADVGVAVVDQVKGLDWRHGCLCGFVKVSVNRSTSYSFCLRQ